MMEIIPQSLFWVPVAAPLAASVVFAVPSCRRHASTVFLVPFFAGLSVSFAIWAPHAPTWLLSTFLSDSAVFFVGPLLAALAGGWLGVVLARPAQAFLSSKRLGITYLFLAITAVVGFFVSLLPAALWHDAMAGGSGFGMATPRLFLDLIRKYYFPVFRRLHVAGGFFVAGVPALIASALATLAQAALICSLVVRLWNCRTKPCTTTSGSAPSAAPEAREG